MTRDRVNQLITDLRATLETRAPQDVYDPSLKETCDLLANPPEVIFGWINSRGGPMSLYIAQTPWFGTIAAAEEQTVWLTTIDPSDMSLPDRFGRFIDSEHELYKGNTPPVTMTATELQDALDGFGSRPDVKRAAYLIEQTPYWSGELYCEFWNEHIGRRATTEPIRVYGIEDDDTNYGAFALTAKPTHHGRELTFAPVNGNDVAKLLAAERNDLGRD